MSKPEQKPIRARNLLESIKDQERALNLMWKMYKLHVGVFEDADGVRFWCCSQCEEQSYQGVAGLVHLTDCLLAGTADLVSSLARGSQRLRGIYNWLADRERRAGLEPDRLETSGAIAALYDIELSVEDLINGA